MRLGLGLGINKPGKVAPAIVYDRNAYAGVTLADVALSSTSKLAIAAASSVTLGAVTVSSAGNLAIKGVASITLDAVTASAEGAFITMSAQSLGALAGITRRKVVTSGSGDDELLLLL